MILIGKIIDSYSQNDRITNCSLFCSNKNIIALWLLYYQRLDAIKKYSFPQTEQLISEKMQHVP